MTRDQITSFNTKSLLLQRTLVLNNFKYNIMEHHILDTNAENQMSPAAIDV
jgi:hypothetical protein